MTMQINGTSGLVFNDASTQNTAATGFGFKNRLINSDMRIDQRNNGALVPGAVGVIYGVDRFITGVFGSGTGRISAQQSSTAPTGFVKSLVNTVTTADAAPTANFGYSVVQRIEGYNVADLGWGTANAQTITLSFWVRSSLTGTYVVSFVNDGITWGYSTTYTVSAANTWEQKTVTIPGPTSGTWETTNATGIAVIFGLGGGSNRQATLNSWYAPIGTNSPTDAAGCVDWIATSGATFYITGVQLEKGSTATSFDYRPYGTELNLCQRYCQAIGNGLSGISAASNNVWFNPSLSPQMRASPTASLLSTAITISDNYLADWTSSGSTVGTNNLRYDGGRINILGFSSLVTGRWYGAYNNTNSFLLLSAEL